MAKAGPGTGAPPTFEVDYLVIGGGMAGMSSAAFAAERGAQVMVVEKTANLGGSAVLSAGYCWTAASYEDLRRENPLGDPALGHVLVDGYDDAIEWLASANVEVGERVSMVRAVGHGIGHAFDVIGHIQRCRTAVEAAEGWVLTGVTVEALMIAEGRVVGARVRDRDGETEIRASWTLIATGGFQLDAESRRKYIGNAAVDMLVRSNEGSTGDGLKLGIAAGAAVNDAMDGFYGHTMCAPIDHPLRVGDYSRLSQSYSPHGLLLTATGERFVDESRGYFTNAQAVLRQPRSRALLVFDECVRREWANVPPVVGQEAVDKLQEAAGSGAHTASADTLEALASEVGAWGYDPEGVVRTVTSFDAQVVADPEGLVPTRVRNRRAFDEAPFHAVEVQPAITFTHGGLRINANAQVLDGSGHPIPGLLAAGIDGGGVYNQGYTGGLAMALVFALQAARRTVSEPAT